MNDISKEIDLTPKVVTGYLISTPTSPGSSASPRRIAPDGSTEIVFITELNLVEEICKKLEPRANVEIARYQFITKYSDSDPMTLFLMNTGDVFDVDPVTQQQVTESSFEWDGPSNEAYSQDLYLSHINSQIEKLRLIEYQMRHAEKFSVGTSVNVVFGPHRGKSGIVIGRLNADQVTILRVEKRIPEDSGNIIVYFPVGSESAFPSNLGMAKFKCSLFKEIELN